VTIDAGLFKGVLSLGNFFGGAKKPINRTGKVALKIDLNGTFVVDVLAF